MGGAGKRLAECLARLRAGCAPGGWPPISGPGPLPPGRWFLRIGAKELKARAAKIRSNNFRAR